MEEAPAIVLSHRNRSELELCSAVRTLFERNEAVRPDVRAALEEIAMNRVSLRVLACRALSPPSAKLVEFLRNEASSATTDAPSIPRPRAVATALEALGEIDPEVALGCATRLLSDPHPRVRRAAFTRVALSPPSSLPSEARRAVCSALLGDTDDDVRLACTVAVAALDGRQEDPFVLLCAAVASDQSPAVRARACRLLGDFPRAAARARLALSKKPPGASAKGGSSMAEDSLPAGALPTGDVEMSKSALTEIASLESTAAGALVHAVEDEFFQVREAAVDTLTKLATAPDCDGAFAEKALDFLADMLNDQIDSVRVRSVNALRTVARSNRIPLRPEQLGTLLSALEESSSAVRTAIHDMLAEVTLPGLDAVHNTIDGLLKNLAHDPDDRDTIFLALKGIGTRHASEVKQLVKKILHIDPRYAPVERRLDDPQYIACTIAIFNAARVDSGVIPLLPRFALSHVVSMHESLPSLFPESLEAPVEMEISGGEAALVEGYDVRGFFATALSLAYGEAVRLIGAGKHDEAAQLLRECSRDVRRSSTLEPSLLSLAEFHLEHFACMRAIVAMKRRAGKSVAAAHKVIKGCYSLERCLFRNVPNGAVFALRLMRCMAHLFLLTSGSATAPDFAARVESLVKFCDSASIPKSQELVDLFNGSLALVRGAEGLTIAGELVSVFQRFVPRDPVPGDDITKIATRIILPESNPDRPMEFHPALPLAIPVRCRVSSISDDLRSLLVRLRFPEGGEKYFQILPKHVVTATAADSDPTFPIGQPSVVLSVPVRVSWLTRAIELTCLEISLVRKFSPDVMAPDTQIPGFSIQHDTDLVQREANLFLPLCQPVKYFVNPKRP